MVLKLISINLRFCWVIVFFVFFSCASKVENIAHQDELIRAKLGEAKDITFLDCEKLDEKAFWRGSLPFHPFVEIPSSYIVLAGVEAKFTRDSRLSQAIVVCDSACKNQLYLLFLDYDKEQQKVGIVFKTLLLVENQSSLTIKAEDVTGDGQKEILIQGFNSQDESVLEVFKHFDNSKGELLLIFSQVIKGTLTVVAYERAPNYERANWKPESFPIKVCYETLLNNGMVQEYQEWHEYSPSLARYCLVKREEAQQNINRQFLGYLQKGKKGVMDLLSGPWYKKELKGQTASLFFFDEKKERLQFYNRGRQEVFLWEYSSLPSVQTFYVVAHNDLVEMIRNSFRIHLLDMNTIEISSDADETMELSGIFKRMSSSVQDAVVNTGLTKHGANKEAIIYPEGLFAGPKDARVEFKYPRLIWREADKLKEGIFDIFYFKGYQILQWQLKEEQEAFSSQSFVLEYRQNEQNAKGKSSLILRPISLLFNRIYFEEGAPSLHFDPFSSHF